MVLELPDAGDFLTFIKKMHKLNAPVKEREAITAEIFGQLLEGLMMLDAKGIIHGDITLANLRLASDPKHPGRYITKLADFGLASLSKEFEYITEQEAAADPNFKPIEAESALRYMAPELKKLGTRAYSHKSDIFAVGMAALVAVTRSANPTIKTRGVSKEFVDFFRQATASDPSKRPTAKELLQHPWLRLHQPVSSQRLATIMAISLPSKPNNDSQPPVKAQTNTVVATSTPTVLKETSSSSPSTDTATEPSLPPTPSIDSTQTSTTTAVQHGADTTSGCHSSEVETDCLTTAVRDAAPTPTTQVTSALLTTSNQPHIDQQIQSLGSMCSDIVVGSESKLIFYFIIL